MKKETRFYSEGCSLAADLYYPEPLAEGRPHPAIVLCHGFAGIKEALLPPFAEAFAANGFVAMAFDYRGFGDSEGERGRLFYPEQVRDIRNAVTYLQSLPEVDPCRIGLWGSSYGGANAITCAAADDRVQCLVAQLTFGDGERVITGPMTAEEREKLRSTLLKVWTRAVTHNKPLCLAPGQILTDEQSKAFISDLIAKHPKINVKIPMQFLQYTLEYKPENAIGELTIPVLLVAAEKDSVNPASETHALFARAREPKQLVVLEGATHYACYDGEYFRRASQAAADWFRRYLA